MKPVTIIGGGIAGLATGIGLRRRDVPVTLHEAGTYPRHKVCGEFIFGYDREGLRRLGVWNLLHDVLSHEYVTWFLDEEKLFEHSLSKPALGISRYRLDALLAQEFEQIGGNLRVSSRASGKEAPYKEGVVWATGRELNKRSPWVGLKAHYRDLSLTGDLELHLGDGAYIGMSAVEDGWTNVCGLFRQPEEMGGKRQDLIPRVAARKGLPNLANRLRSAELRGGSVCGVTGLNLWSTTALTGRAFVLGDAWNMIPPFTGNGMSRAFEGAALAVPHLEAYSIGKMSWADAISAFNKSVNAHMKRRFLAARTLHPIIYRRPLQRVVARLVRAHFVPVPRLVAIFS